MPRHAVGSLSAITDAAQKAFQPYLRQGEAHGTTRRYHGLPARKPVHEYVGDAYPCRDSEHQPHKLIKLLILE